MLKGQLTTVFGLLAAIGGAVVAGMAAGIIPAENLPPIVKGLAALAMVIGTAGASYFAKDYNVTGGTVVNPDGVSNKPVVKAVLLLILCGVILPSAGCTRLPLSMEARADLAGACRSAATLEPKCRAGEAAACELLLAIQQQSLRKLASSIDGSDPNYAGWVGWQASANYKTQIRKADLLASHARDGCQAGDPNFCRVGLNLVPVLERLKSASAGTK